MAKQCTYEFSVLSPGTLNSSTNRLDFFRADLFGGGEEQATFWGYFRSDGSTTYLEFNPTNYAVQLPTNTWVTIAIQVDPTNDLFQLYVDGTKEIEFTLSSMWFPTNEIVEFLYNFTVFSGTECYIDEYRKSDVIRYNTDTYLINPSMSNPTPPSLPYGGYAFIFATTFPTDVGILGSYGVPVPFQASNNTEYQYNQYYGINSSTFLTTIGSDTVWGPNGSPFVGGGEAGVFYRYGPMAIDAILSGGFDLTNYERFDYVFPLKSFDVPWVVDTRFNGVLGDFEFDVVIGKTFDDTNGVFYTCSGTSTPDSTSQGTIGIQRKALPDYGIPSISGFTPSSGFEGTPTTINGTNLFGTSEVYFTGVLTPVTPTSASNSAVDVVVPFGATTGPVNIVRGSKTAVSPSSFTVTYATKSITLRSTSGEMTYWSTYLADFPSVTAVGGTFDTSAPHTPDNTSFPSNKEVFFNPPATQTVIGTTTMTTGTFAWEFSIDSGIPSWFIVGYWNQSFGPSFDPNVSGGGSYSSYWNSIGNLGGWNSGTAPTYTYGDILGIIYNTGTGVLTYYKNGVQVATGYAVGTGGTIMCGSYN